MKQPMNPTRVRVSSLLLIAGLALFSLGGIVPLAIHLSGTTGLLSPWTALRVLGLLLLAAFALRRRSLTTWIFWSMLAGVELGLDAPNFSSHLHVFSDVFLRLIKMIVAPLIFGTLVTGIAGHGEMRGLGRLGLKSLVFFEILTTLALAIGLVAINISQAGTGLAMKHQAAEQGIVKWYNDAKGFGFLSRTSGEDVFVSRSAITDSGLKTLQEGEAVQFNVVKGAKGWQAKDVQPVPATPPAAAPSAAPAIAPAASLTWDQFLLHAVPENLAKAVAENQILQVAVFAVFFGLALSRVSEATRAPLLRLAESLTETMFALTNLVMYFAPIGVGAALAFTVGHLGLGVMVNLGKLLLTLYAALIVFALLVLLPSLLVARIPLRRFLAAVAEPATIAFATSASEAALPRAMEEMEAFGVPRKIVGFVIPAGYSFNLTGSALYLALASGFVAQAAGIHMTWGEQAFMMLMLMLTSKGVAGVPRAVLVVLLATASTFHLPEEPIFVILGVDALMDMGRTAVNVVGNCLAAAVVAQWEGEFGSEAPSELAVAALED
jgi:Na+/H+-dicarboxylate symporter